MPKVSWAIPKTDYIRALILERKRSCKKTNEDLGSVIGVSRKTMEKMLDEGTGTWRVDHLFKITHYLDIPKDRVKELL